MDINIDYAMAVSKFIRQKLKNIDCAAYKADCKDIIKKKLVYYF